MKFSDVHESDKDEFNHLVTHPLQSYEWGEFRKKTGIKVIRKIAKENSRPLFAFQMTLHPIPHTPWSIGYLPKGLPPSDELIKELLAIGKENKCIFIQLEPHSEKTFPPNFSHKTFPRLVHSARPLFTPFNFILDIRLSEEQLLEAMHPKTRYNIKIARKHGVTIQQTNTDKAFQMYLTLTSETTKRQKFYAHSTTYHTLMWQTLQQKQPSNNPNHLTAYLFTATHDQDILATWVLFSFHDTLYYPYGASSSQKREVMASNLMMWEAIRFGKSLGLSFFDMWGALSHNADSKNPWYGFHRFKMGYSPRHVEYIGSFDLVIHPLLYQLFIFFNTFRWILLKFKK